MSGFRRATKAQARLRMAIVGPSGSGKSYSGLLICRELVGPDGKIAAIDTERGSLSKYANVTEFDVNELKSFAPEVFIDAIDEAEAAGYGALLIDSLSHAWMGKDGILEMVDAAAARSKSNNTFAGWRDATPAHNSLVDRILRSNMHVIATMRSKSEWVLEKNERGVNVPRKIGMQPVQRDGMEFEFDVCGDIDIDHNFVVTKTRCSELDGKKFPKPGKQVGKILNGWLADGTPIVQKPTEPERTDPKPAPEPRAETPKPDASALRAQANLEEQRELIAQLKSYAEIIGKDRCRELVGSPRTNPEMAQALIALEAELMRLSIKAEPMPKEIAELNAKLLAGFAEGLSDAERSDVTAALAIALGAADGVYRFPLPALDPYADDQSLARASRNAHQMVLAIWVRAKIGNGLLWEEVPDLNEITVYPKDAGSEIVGVALRPSSVAMAMLERGKSV